MTRTVLEIQRRLTALGFDPGPIDGIQGPKTDAAIVEFKRSKGLRPRPYIGPITETLLFNDAARPPAPAERDLPPWMRVAFSCEGMREIPGSRHNDRIVGMWERLKLPYRDDETPWCAAFVGYCLEMSGIPSTRSASARSYTAWKHGVQIKAPVPGCIVVFWRGSRNGWSGHVGFAVSRDGRGRINVLGGNQANAVNVKPFNLDRVLGYYWPQGHDLPEGGLPLAGSLGASSTNEA